MTKMPVEPEIDTYFHFLVFFATKAEFGPGCSEVVGCGRLWKGETKMPARLLFTIRATYILLIWPRIDPWSEGGGCGAPRLP